jgi:hypothetical protein
MTILDYSNHKPIVHLTGTPHARGAKDAVGQLRNAVRDLVVVLAGSGWADDHPIDDDKVALDVIELVNHLGPAERHVLRIATSVLVKVTARNGYHTYT